MSALDKVEFLPRKVCPLHDREGSADANRGDLPVFKVVDDKLTGRTFRILRCETCGVLLTDPYPSEATVRWLYEGRDSANYDPVRGTIMDRLKDLFARREIGWVHAAAGRPKICSVLDFGTANGRFALASKKLFPESIVDAVDFDAEPPPELRGVPGVRYLPLALFQGASPPGAYDLIILRNVLEHMHDPAGLLRVLTQRLAPNGILYIALPNIDSAIVRFFSSLVNPFFVPYHLFHFDSATSLGNLLRTAGLSSSISTKTVPMAGCVLCAFLKQKQRLWHQVFGVVLHPVQMTLDFFYGKLLFVAVCRHRIP